MVFSASCVTEHVLFSSDPDKDATVHDAAGPDGDGDIDVPEHDADLDASEGDASDGEVDADEGGDADGDTDRVTVEDGDSDGDVVETDPCFECVPGEWVMIPAGEFVMGSPETEEGRSGNEQQHPVTLTRSFMMQTTEVTIEQFGSWMGYLPPMYYACEPECPVDSVSWHEAAAYTNVLSDLAGVPRCYDCPGPITTFDCSLDERWASPYECPGFRLPTDAEWEYAARAGTTTATYAGDIPPDDTGCEGSLSVLDPIAWYCCNAGDTPHAVGGKLPNELGLYDMLGNVSEWVNDFYSGWFPPEPVIDPVGPDWHWNRVLRSGCWSNIWYYQRAAHRIEATGTPDFRPQGGGFRPVRTLLDP
jgi:formylglycine-generating enzyme required for sulfatase activity